MTQLGLSLMEELDSLYQRERQDPGFELIASELSTRAERDLADLIEADGRLRVRLERRVTLDRYIEAVPDLPSLPVPLDAAIEMVLKSMARQGRLNDESLALLIAQYPALENPIRDAVALNDIVGSTGRVQRRAIRSPTKPLPTSFGPPQENGGPSRYELRELLGEGAFGQVYLGVDRKFSDKNHPALVAIKILSGLDRSAHARRLLVDEATKARRISHPNVAMVLDCGVSDDGEHYIVYQLVEGGDLERRIRSRRSLDVREAVTLVAKTARGVHAAHMAGLVHCDLKPNNILLTQDSEPKVADFGVAIRADEQGAWHQAESEEREPVGNIAYMSPEQYRMEPGSLTIPTDVYALGGILFRLVTGELPNGSTREKVARVHHPTDGRAAPPALGEHAAEVDHDLEKICGRAMAVTPADRYGSAAELARDLDAWLRREPIAWTRPTVRRRLGLWVRRAPAAALVALMLVVVAVACVLLVIAAQARQARFNALQHLQAFTALLGQFRAAGDSELILPSIWLSEWMYGPTVLGEGPGLRELLDLRVDVVRDYVEAARARGAADHLQTRLWQSALVFWLIKDGAYAEADEILVESRAAWQTRVNQDDEWLDDLRGLQACIDVQRRLDGDTAPADGRGAVDLAAVRRTLERLDRDLTTRAPGSPMHFLILEHRRRLHGPELLDDRGIVKEIEARQAQLRENAPPRRRLSSSAQDERIGSLAPAEAADPLSILWWS